MKPIRSFVVRIYRQDRRSIAGLVEDVRTGQSAFFQSFAGLWAALTTRRRRNSSVPSDFSLGQSSADDGTGR